MVRNPVQFQKGISLNEFLSLYGTEQQCFDALYHWRWPNGFVCPNCGHDRGCQLTTHKLQQCYRAIRAEITRRVCEAKQLPILVIDEAQHLRNDVLEDLRLLTNFAMDSENRLCLLLVGLTELRRRLAMAVHESLSQRLIVRHHLNGLDRDELDHYLTHRLRLAGCELPLFEPPAVEALFQSTRGLPRLINRIAHYALTAAALGNARTVTAEHLEHAVAELRL